ncbi:methyl-accepting chemotaxis protein [Alsobacter soli]|nr:methyl-accepting chemotaxis protein [Alsobacter soli]
MSFRSLKFRIIVILAPVLTLLLLGALLFLFVKQQSAIAQSEEAKVQATVQILAEAAANAVLVSNLTAMESLLKAAQLDADFEAGLIGESARYMAMKIQRPGAEPISEKALATQIGGKPEAVLAKYPERKITIPGDHSNLTLFALLDDMDRSKIVGYGAVRHSTLRSEARLRADVVVAAVTAGGVVLSVLGALYVIVAWQTGPLAQLAQVTRKLAAGDHSADVDMQGRQDEIGAMAAALAVFREKAVALVASERAREEMSESARATKAHMMQELKAAFGLAVEAACRGRFDAMIERDFSDPEMRELRDGLNALLTQLTEQFRDVLAVLRAIEAGDLGARVEGAREGVFSELQHGLNMMADSLAATLTRVRDATAKAEMSASEIAAGAADLSRQSEQQAAQIAQTTEMAARIAQSVDASARACNQAAEKAERAASSARRGGEVAALAQAAMERIEGNSSKISDITSVINGIAFQTNLLALNASVEAARAGEAGKGFAVVAAEVRTLAQRSTEASKHISDLLSSSAEEVAQGGELVRQVGEALALLVEAGEDVLGTVAGFVRSAQEQAQGIGAISQTMRDLDAMTHRNTRVAEEGAASATALREQIVALQSLVERYGSDNGLIASKAGRRPQRPMALSA